MTKTALIRLCSVISVVVLGSVTASPAAPTLDATEIVARLINADPWGLSGTTITAHVTLTDKSGARRELSFNARSRRYDPPYSKSLVRFTAPADLAGAGFLQVQNRGGDDDRYLFLPELKRSRRISGGLRSNSFMGTDFSFADLDRRDLRESVAKRLPDENIGPFACFHLDTTPSRADSPYSRVELWIRTDNSLPLRMRMYDKAGVLFKTFAAKEVRRSEGRWYIVKSRMTDLLHNHETELVIDTFSASSDVPDNEFTLRNLERL